MTTFSEDETREMFRVVNGIVKEVQPILKGHGPEIQGAAIADILSIYVTAHAPHLREKAMTFLVDTALKLIPINEQALFPNGKHPYVEVYGEGDGNHDDNP